jgi:hypothetical protein
MVTGALVVVVAGSDGLAEPASLRGTYAVLAKSAWDARGRTGRCRTAAVCSVQASAISGPRSMETGGRMDTGQSIRSRHADGTADGPTRCDRGFRRSSAEVRLRVLKRLVCDTSPTPMQSVCTRTVCTAKV